MPGSSPRSNSVPRIDGSISDQSRRDAASTVSMSVRSSASAVSSSNSPPLNQSTVSKPTRPPEAITRNRSPASSAKCPGVRCACSSIRVNMWPGSSPTSSANMQKTSRLTKCATACGSWPRSRSDCASVANDSAAFSVSDCRVSPGRSRSGSENAHLSRSRVAASARSSRSNSCVLLTQLVQLVRMRNRCMSETISSGGFSSASAYSRSCPNAASRSARLPLYSHAKWWRFHTSAQPSPPVSLRAPRSKQYASPVGSVSAGVGSPRSRHRSMKCSCEAERSFNSAARHLAMNSYGVMGAFSVAHEGRHCYDAGAARPCRGHRRHRRASQREHVLAGVKALRSAPTPLRGARP